MAFFDDVSSFTKGVGAQLKGNYDVVALNTKISGLQKEISSLYERLGSEYYSAKKDSPDPVVAGVVEEIKQKFNEIAAVQSEIDKTKNNLSSNSNTAQAGGRYCVNCGALVEKGNIFCVQCGTRQPEKNPQPVQQIPPVPPVQPVQPVRPIQPVQQMERPQAVAPVSAPQPMASQTPMESGRAPFEISQPAMESKKVETKVLVCPKCGMELSDDSVFCSECGTRI